MRLLKIGIISSGIVAIIGELIWLIKFQMGPGYLIGWIANVAKIIFVTLYIIHLILVRKKVKQKNE